MTKSIQQIVEDQRAQSGLNKLNPNKVGLIISNISRAGDQAFSETCSKSKQATWDDPIKGPMLKEELKKKWRDDPEKMIKNRRKEIQTPWGIYPSRQDAITAAKEQGIAQPGVIIRLGLIDNPKEFYYTTKLKKTMSQEARDRMVKTKEQNGARNWKRVQTPFGIAPKMKDAVLLMRKNGVMNAGKKLPKLLKTPGSGYCIID